MRGKIAAGIDIGTYQIKVVVSEETSNGNGMPKIIGIGYAESKGLRHGYIINQSDAIRSIRKAIRQAEQHARVKIDKVFVSIGGIGLSSIFSKGTIMISRADSEITDIDMEKVHKDAEAKIPNSLLLNNQVIHKIPVSYKIDDKKVLGNPIGMKGVKFEAEMMFVVCLQHHITELTGAIEGAGLEINHIIAAPIAAGLVTLSKTERIAGCVLVNIGSQTVSILVYEDDVPILLEVLPDGSNEITNDLALNLKVSLDDAEKIKMNVNNPDYFEEKSTHKKINDLVYKKIKDTFKIIDASLKKINKSGLLPAGIIITGGGSSIIDIEDLAKATLQLPSRVAKLNCSKDNIKIKDATWAVSYGLCVYGLNSDEDYNNSQGGIFGIFKVISDKIKHLFHSFLP